MARCAVCRHEKREFIDEDLSRGNLSQAEIGHKYGLSQSVVSRHSRLCVAKQIVERSRAIAAEDGVTLVDQIEDIKSKTMAIYEAAAEGISCKQCGFEFTTCPECGERVNSVKSPALALTALDRLTKQIEVFAEMMFKYEEMSRSEHDVHNDMEWLELRARIVSALEPYPAARAAVAKAIEDASGEV